MIDNKFMTVCLFQPNYGRPRSCCECRILLQKERRKATFTALRLSAKKSFIAKDHSGWKTMSICQSKVRLDLITQVDGIAGQGVCIRLSVCLSVLPHDISITDAARITELDTRDDFWKFVYFWIKRSEIQATSHKNMGLKIWLDHVTRYVSITVDL